jgi:hypothetical protein
MNPSVIFSCFSTKLDHRPFGYFLVVAARQFENVDAQVAHVHLLSPWS